MSNAFPQIGALPFVYLIGELDAKGKLPKTPIGASGYNADPKFAGHAAAFQQLATLQQTGKRAAAGIYLPKNCGFTFVDIDGGCDMQTGLLSPAAQLWLSHNPTAWREWSIGGNGIHILGRTPQTLPPGHSCKIPGGDLYSGERGLCVGYGGDGDVNAVIVVPPGISTTQSTDKDYAEAVALGVMEAWDGFTDDDELIAAFRRSTGSALSLFNGALTNAQLFDGEAAADSDNDSKLAERLSWWTGADAERIHRLMMRSGMVRDKWIERSDYYLPRTIADACMKTRRSNRCYVRPVAPVNLPPLALPASMPAGLPTLAPVAALPMGILDAATGTHAVDSILMQWDRREDYDTVVARLRPVVAGMSKPDYDYTCKAFLNKTKQLNFTTITLAAIRREIPDGSGPAMPNSVGAPDGLLDDYVYLVSSNQMHTLRHPTPLKMEAAERDMLKVYGQTLPFKNNGMPMSPTELYFGLWHGRQAYASVYLPGKPRIVNRKGITYSNSFDPDTLPTASDTLAPTSAALLETIGKHLRLVCDSRDDIYDSLMVWLANVTLRPGKKIAWAPLIQGAEGSGKSFMGFLIRKALGDDVYRDGDTGQVTVETAGHVSIVGPNELGNSGGFTDWAIGKAITILEEIYVTGGRKWDITNVMKNYLADPLVSITRKGATPLADFPNVTNYIAFTNHRDAVPVTNTGRRWLVIFTTTLDSMLAGRAHYMEHEYFPALWDALLDVPSGDLMLWLSAWLDKPLPRRAPMSAERAVMSEESDSDLTSAMRDYCDGHGVVVLETVCNWLLMRGVVAAKDKRAVKRALNDVGLQRWLGGGNRGRTRLTHDSPYVTLYTNAQLNNESSAKMLMQLTPPDKSATHFGNSATQSATHSGNG